ncbi:unnamed protein product [Cuscuta campestris]|uniref:Zinc/iron-chelating domain-containing protein n=1 Tax=Cuscuta campestris TaxID=132261 RepID=A0A484K906_9ASTE|nr:unnamed protein product [Cuscuta campestris]
MSFLSLTVVPPRFAAICSAARRGRNSEHGDKRKRNAKPTEQSNAAAGADVSIAKKNPPGFGSRRKDPMWKCIENCGACCKLHKPQKDFPSPEEIFDDYSDIELYKSMVGEDGWCIHFEKSTRKCSIYAERPYFCRVEPEVFETLYGIDKKKFNREACSCCIDTIKAVYGTSSEELGHFDQAIWSSSA